MTAPLTLTAYAKLRGVSTKSVSRAIAAGRLVASVGRDHLGRPTITDPDLAGREWDTNTRQRTEPPPAASESASNARPAGSRWSRAFLPPPRPESSEPADARAPLQSEASAARPPPADIPDLNTSRAIREAALARRDTANADIAELDLAERRGILVEAKQVYANFEDHIAIARTKLLAIPSRLGQEAPELAARVVPVAERLIREALEELAIEGQAASGGTGGDAA